MKATELRIGSWYKAPMELTGSAAVKVNLNDEREFRLTLDSLTLLHQLNLLDLVRAVPLTEEWLVRFGFEKHGTHHYKFPDKNLANFLLEHSQSNINYYSFVTIRQANSIPVRYAANIYLEYIHQLQNLFFALTGNELIVSETANLN